jgi:hypothetical protein
MRNAPWFLKRVLQPFYRPLAAAALALVLAVPGWGDDRPAPGDRATESENRLRASVEYLASDALEGRGVGTAGLDKAADYIAEQFSSAGLKTDLFHGTPFQEFEVTVASEMGPAEHNRLVLSGPAGDEGQPRRTELKLSESFTPLAIGGSGTFDAPLVLAGYGITAKNLKRGDETLSYDDYAGIDVAGKIVLLIRKEPQQQDEKSPFDGKRASQYATFQRKLAHAREHGAAAVIIVNDAAELTSRQDENRKQLAAALDKLAELRTAAKDSAAKAHGKEHGKEPEDEAASQKRLAAIHEEATKAAELSKSLTESRDALLPFTGAGDTSATNRKMPVFFCTRAALDPVVQAALGKSLALVEAEIDRDLTPQSAALAGWRASGEADVIEKKVPVKNVVGVLAGSGELADETIVIGAHYDHLGLGGSGSLAPWTSAIHNGADDNASGTATLIEAARRLAAHPDKPRRRLVFIAFTGEERGLLGSAHYTREPRFPLEKTVAMFNLDMVGRLKDDKLAVYGTGTAKEFEPLVEQLCGRYGFQLTKHPGGYGPSDHSSFYSKKIPVLHLFTGTHTDYHRPSDDADKLNIAGMRRVADFLVDVVRATDAAAARPTYVEIRRVERIADSGDGGDRPSFGSMPAYPNPATDGVMLEAVLEGSAAEKAGIRGGDVLLQLGDDKITVLEDFEAALRRHKPGDKVKVIVRRGDKRVEGEATLTRRRALP